MGIERRMMMLAREVAIGLIESISPIFIQWGAEIDAHKLLRVWLGEMVEMKLET
jgi:hypothetical protein